MNNIMRATGAATLALTLMAGAGVAQAHDHHGDQRGVENHQQWNGGFDRHERGDHDRHREWRGGFLFVPAPVIQGRDVCTVANSWNQLVARDAWPYPSMNFYFRANCENGTSYDNGYTFYHQTVY